MVGAVLAIFPQRRVLLPGSTQVLRAYDALQRRLIDELDGQRFGVALIRTDGHGFYDVGTEVVITDRTTTSDGRLSVLASGERRFLVLGDVGSRPYPTAEVEFLPEAAGDTPGDAKLAARVSRLLRRYLVAAAESGLGGDVMADIPSDPVALSYRVASLVRLSSPERQELLELPARARLNREASLLTREVDLLERMMGMERT